MVHPTSTVKGWFITLRIREPEVYDPDKLRWCETLQQLYRYVSMDNLPELPVHVLDKDQKRLRHLRH